jgi:hypothetical protein
MLRTTTLATYHVIARLSTAAVHQQKYLARWTSKFQSVHAQQERAASTTPPQLQLLSEQAAEEEAHRHHPESRFGSALQRHTAQLGSADIPSKLSRYKPLT